MNVTKVKQATVVYIDGKTVAVNVSGETETDGLRKGKLKAEQLLDLRDARTIHAYREGESRDTAKPIRVAEVRPGDKISAGWAANPAGAAKPTSATVVQVSDPQLPGQTLTLTPAHQLSQSEQGSALNYPNTHQDSAPTKDDSDEDEPTDEE